MDPWAEGSSPFSHPKMTPKMNIFLCSSKKLLLNEFDSEMVERLDLNMDSMYEKIVEKFLVEKYEENIFEETKVHAFSFCESEKKSESRSVVTDPL